LTLALALFFLIPLLSVQDDGLGEEAVAEFFHPAQGLGKEGVIENFLVESRNPGVLLVKAEDAAQHPVGKMKGMGEANGVDAQVVFFHVPG
jgi:hypothetical protein